MRPSEPAAISRAILDRLGAGRLIALDTDPSAASLAARISDERFTFIHANFRELDGVLERVGLREIDGVLFDLGVSSMQLDDPQRGFSLTKPAPLDMVWTQDPGTAPTTCSRPQRTGTRAHLLPFGEERAARRIARAIVNRRASGALPQTTAEFAALVSGIVQRSGKRERIHPATRAFRPCASPSTTTRRFARRPGQHRTAEVRRTRRRD